MLIFDTIVDHMKAAMRARDKDRLRALRQIRAALMLEAKKTGDDTLDDATSVTVLRRLAKQRADSISSYQAAGRDDLVEIEVAELAVVNAYLPQLADEATTRDWVVSAVAETGAGGPSEMGKVMGALMRAHKGEMDGNLAKRLVMEVLKG